MTASFALCPDVIANLLLMLKGFSTLLLFLIGEIPLKVLVETEQISGALSRFGVNRLV